MLDPKHCVVYSGGAQGAEETFGRMAEQYGLQEVNFSFEDHKIARERGRRVLTSEELTKKDVSLSYVSRLMNRDYSRAPIFRKVLQSICWQIASGHEVYVVGTIQDDGTVRGGTGWGAEYAKICNKPLFVFGQRKNAWFKWTKNAWLAAEPPVISQHHIACTGTRFLKDNGKQAIEDLFARSFGK
ncbi:MAG: hypothetical protein CSA21_02000 [Deltaproteobacteria bacterium]|nr:MAG: hypothetical protein CSA21_02000 [Deltaproteobacteria bacterium]